MALVPAAAVSMPAAVAVVNISAVFSLPQMLAQMKQ
jgi:hypothetical protein